MEKEQQATVQVARSQTVTQQVQASAKQPKRQKGGTRAYWNDHFTLREAWHDRVQND